MSVIFILQGPPGSGKSTAAEILSKDYEALVCSTDEFFYQNEEGTYQYVPAKIHEAHEWNQQRVRQLLEKQKNVIVDNTNIRAWEAKPYVEMALEHGYDILFSRYNGRYPNIHGAPEEIVEKMRANMEDLSVHACLKAVKPSFEKPPEQNGG